MIPSAKTLRAFAISAGVVCAILFPVIGLLYRLELYGDGSIFSYAVAVRDAWAFHWHNISGRIAVYALTMAPAQWLVAITGSPNAGIAAYGFLLYVSQALGLLAAFLADRSKERLLFTYACFSTALLCPLVFGFPTEMWLAHALFWPTLALCHYAPRNLKGLALVFIAMLAMVFCHEGALIYAGAILATLLLRGPRDPVFRRACFVFIAVLAVWFIVKFTLQPDSYISSVLERAAFEVFEIQILTGGLMLLIFATLTGYALILLLLHLTKFARAHLYATGVVAAALALYWLKFDHALHAENRYYLRTIVLSGAPPLALLAAFFAISREDSLHFTLPFQDRLKALASSDVLLQAIAGAFALVLLVHAVETAKFVTAWTKYKADIRGLAMSAASDPKLGDPRFVSADRIDPALKPLFWHSTTPYLSALVAPGFTPQKLVIAPVENYFWLSCKTATNSAHAKLAFPAETRELIRVYSCLHRN